jgi:hypothetical protein
MTEEERIRIEAFNNFAQGWYPYHRKDLEDEQKEVIEKVHKLLLEGKSYKTLAVWSGYLKCLENQIDKYETMKKQGLES